MAWLRQGSAGVAFVGRGPLSLVLKGHTFRAAMPVALVVGTILTLANEGSVLVEGKATTATWLRIAVNVAVPFCVASYGFIRSCRVPVR